MTLSTPHTPSREPPPADAPPRARISDFAETVHDVVVRDPYRWLETSSGEQRQYLAAYNAYSRRVLDRIEGREALRRELAADPTQQPEAHMQGVTSRPTRLFYTRQLPGPGGPSLMCRDGWTGAEHVLLDMRPRTTAGASWSVESAHPSPDGQHVVAELHKNGSEQPHLEILEVTRGVSLPGRVDATNEPSISWHPDGRSFYYSAAGAGDVYQHDLDGPPRADRLVFGASLPELRISTVSHVAVYATVGSAWLIGEAHPGTSGYPELFVAPLAHAGAGPRAWRRFVTAADQAVSVTTRGDHAYVVVRTAGDRERIVAIELDRGSAAGAREVLAASDVQIHEICAASDALYLRLATGLRRVTTDGAAVDDIPLPMKGIVSYVWCEPDAPGVAFGVHAKTIHEAFFYRPGVPIRSARLYRPVITDASSVVTERVEVPSADGTRVPMRITYRKGLPRDGEAPALLSGYAAYGSPDLDVDGVESAWTRRGGVTATCGARGGGERGEAWHRDGQKLHKENGVDDFLACARYLIAQGYTSAARLTAIGASAGGVLVGGAITKHPELFTAAILLAPIANLVRLEATPIGTSNIAEFGDPAIADEFRAMLASDPLHRIRDGVRYPAVLLRTGRDDSRIPPWQAAKLAARLLAASASGRPVLLHVPRGQGHLLGTRSQQVENTVDEYAFALWQSGL